MSAAQDPERLDIAVVGLSALLPGAGSPEDFWRNVVNGRDLLREVPPTHWSAEDYYDSDPAASCKTYARRGGFLDPVEFDPLEYGIPPNQIEAIDTTQLLALVVAKRLLDDVTGGDHSRLDGERVGVLLGGAALSRFNEMGSALERPAWMRGMRAAGVDEPLAAAAAEQIAAQYVPWQEATFPGLLTNVVAGRIANYFDLHGPNYTVDAACAGSLAAVSAAVNELALGRCDMVVSGGVDTLNDPLMYVCFSKTPALSPTGDCRPFADAADGTMLGEGLVMLAFKRRADAERDGDRIYALLQGLGSSSDGRGTAIYAPVPEGQARALRRAYHQAGYGPESVELVEAHGTGTAAGDAAEFAGLSLVFREAANTGRPWCAVGSVKSQIGHTKLAAGATSLLKAVLALHHKAYPPSIKIEKPSPRLALDGSPLYLNTELRPWIRDSAHPRRASVSSFGFGGSNFHVALEEYVPPAGVERRPVARVRTVDKEVFLFCADSPAELVDRLLQADLSREGLPHTARLTQLAFRADADARVMVIAADEAQLRERLLAAADRVSTTPGQSFALPDGTRYERGGPVAAPLAFLFSGQGSQYVGMGAGLALNSPAALAAWDSVADWHPDGAPPLHRVVFPPPVFTDEDRAAQTERLTATEWAQPALAAQCLAQLAVLAKVGVHPAVTAGHSFGELVALHAAGCFDRRELLRLARGRGECLRDAAGAPGGMAAVGCGYAQARALLDLHRIEDVWIANNNAPEQVVLSGTLRSLERAQAVFGEAEIAVTRLQTATAFHSPVVAAAVEPFRALLADIPVQPPTLQVFSNSRADVYPAQAEEVRARLAEHLVSPVRFADEIDAMYGHGVRTFVEIGAGSVLTRLTGRILGGREHFAISLDQQGKDGFEQFQSALGALAVHGVPIDFAPLWRDHPTPATAETSDHQQKGKRMTTEIFGANPHPQSSHQDQQSSGPPTAAVLRIQEAHQQLTAANAACQLAMNAFVSTVEATLVGLPTGPTAPATTPPAATPVASPAAPATAVTTPIAAAPAATTAEPAAPAPAVLSAPAVPNLPDPMAPPPAAPLAYQAPVAPAVPVAPAPAAAPAAPAPPAAPAAPAAAAPAGGNAESILFTAVSELTGYPVEVLNADMDIETDLGIDSIKRVQIVSRVRKAIPELSELDPAVMMRLRSLGQIKEALDQATGAGQLPSLEDPPGGPCPPGPARLVPYAVPAHAPGLCLPGLTGTPLMVTDDGTGVATALVTMLREHGLSAEAAAGSLPADTPGVIVLDGLCPPEGSRAAVDSAFRAARAVASRMESSGGVFVTVQDTGGDFGLGGRSGDRAEVGGLAALARTAAREWRTAAVKSIDIDRGGRTPEQIAQEVAKELLTGGAQSDVGLRSDGGRVRIRTAVEPAPPARGAGPGPDDHIVVTGGARGVTALCVTELARARRPRLTLLGRTPVEDEPAFLHGAPDGAAVKQTLIARARAAGDPVQLAEISARTRQVLATREVRATLAALAQAGSPARYFTVDGRDPAAVGRALEQARAEFGPVTGIVHGAGVLADRKISEKSDDQFASVFDTKVTSLRTLLTALQPDPLRLLCVFSSVAARVGNPGQCDYAMANETLNHLASAARTEHSGITAKALAWGPWRGGMVTAALAAHFEQANVPLIEAADGARAFVTELADTGSETVQVVLTPDAGRQALDAPDGEEGVRERPLADVLMPQTGFPYLADHSIGGRPVVPVACATEWLLRAAGQELPDAAGRLVLRRLNVLKGIVPEALPCRLTTLGRTGGDGVPHLTLQGVHRHYSTEAAPLDTVPTPPPQLHDATGPLPRPELYDGHVLFHGPRYRALRVVHGLGPGGARGELVGLAALGWDTTEPWACDPAVLDGALQLAGLWGEGVLGGATLPMGVAELCVHRPGAVQRPVECVVAAVEVQGEHAVCDVWLSTADGRVLAELRGVELVRRPD